jgi:hypothetical protein
MPEELIKAIAASYGFRLRDFALIWDGGRFDPSRSTHELLITTRDGRRSTARISHSALSHRDAWKYVGEIEAAFRPLARRAHSRGG